MHKTALSIRTASATALALASIGISAPTTQAQTPTVLSTAETAQLTQLADAYLQRRADAVTTSAALSGTSVASMAMTRAAADDLSDDLSVLRHNGQVLARINGGYSRAEVTVTPDESTVSGDTATVSVTEETRLYFPNVRPGEPEFEAYALPHTLTFKQSTDGAWKLSGDQTPTNDSGPEPSTQITEPIDEPGPIDDSGPINEPGPDGEPAPESPDEGPKPPPSDTELPATDLSQGVKPAASAAYNYPAMINYAKRYWLHANPDYRTYGNDCTNFISQAMHAGGWKTTAGSPMSRGDNRKWFYASHTWSTSYTWAGAENWYWFAQRYSLRTKRTASVWDLRPSDVLQVDWAKPRPDGNINHTMMVTDLGLNELYLTYHTRNTLNKKLTTLLAENPGASWYGHKT